MALCTSQKQVQTLSPQMIQSVEILQLGSQELLEYVTEAVQENPVLELDEQHSRHVESSDLRHRLEWLESSDHQNRYYHQQDSEDASNSLPYYGTVEMWEDSLYSYVSRQLRVLNLSPELAACAEFLAACLNQNGWLDEDLTSLAQELAQPIALMEQALAAVQSLNPAGVGARSLSECLRLQLLRQEPVDGLALRIAGEYLDALSKNQYRRIAQALDTTQDAVRRACGRIRGLNPRPGSGFSQGKKAPYITPDLAVIRVDGRFELVANDEFLPSLHISAYYTRMLKESDDDAVKEYLDGKVQQAKWMIQAIEQRRRTLMACAQCLLECQEGFFRYGPTHLAPLSLSAVAGRLGVHESTVSRAVKGKYLQCATGTYPLRYFFSWGLGASGDGRAISSNAAKALLKNLILEEDKGKPLSDQLLCEAMATQGCSISRRTIAKYRDELGIPGASGRKRQGGHSL